MATTPTVELAFGGSFLSLVASTGYGRYEWRMIEKESTISGYRTSDGQLDPISLDLVGSIPAAFVAGSLPEGGRAAQLVDYFGAIPYYKSEHSLLAPAAKPCSIAVVVNVLAYPVSDVFLFGTSSFGVAYSSSGRVVGYYDGSSFADAAMSTGAIHAVAVTRSGDSPNDSVRLYLDGVQVGSATPSVNLSLAIGQALLGRSASLTFGIEATFEHAAVYYGELSAGALLAQYQALSWTGVTDDTIGSAGLVYERGIRSSSPGVRVASTGTLTFSLNNLASNSGGVTGYYSPGHASCRPGFAKGIPVRVKTGSDVQFIGRVRTISPAPGKTSGTTKVLASDFMDRAAVFMLEGVEIQEDVTGDQVFTSIVGLMPNQPHNVTAHAGTETYPLALDNTRDEAVSALAEFSRLALSELGYVYVDRQGGLVYEARGTRITNKTSASVTLSDTMHFLDVADVSASALNRVQITVHPRLVDSAATTVLFALTNPLEIAGGEVKTIIGPYRTPNVPGVTTRVGGVQMTTPVATTDYTMNAQSDGGGSDLTASLGVVANFGANGVQWVLTNNTTETAYVTKLQCRGKGIYDFRTIVVREQDDIGIASDGVSALTIDMVYQENPNVAASMAQSLLSAYGDLSGTRVQSVGIYPDDPGAPSGLVTKDISDRVAVSESITGATGDYYINGVKHEFRNRALAKITWWLTPAEPLSYWILGLSGASELGTTTVLAPG